MASRSVPKMAAIMSERFSMGRWRRAQRWHLTIGPWGVGKRNVVPRPRPRPHPAQRRSTVVAELTRSILCPLPKRGIGRFMIGLRFGQEAPSFTLPSTGGGAVTLSDFKGKSDVVLVFYCYDWGSI
ncbi:MAG: hypothetical protein DME04_09865 [Candidatus Rokuibacteriota bacterium]|nr:MAG: hypothetical protein DME04_09865 [Candidatus Rokubacteria bacterium]